MCSVRSNNLSVKYQKITQSDCKDIGIRRFENSLPLIRSLLLLSGGKYQIYGWVQLNSQKIV